MRKNKGITLIALIITIIVMLILVGVVVTVVIQSDLLGTAKAVGDKYKTAYEEESKMSGVTINGKQYKSIEEYMEGLEAVEPGKRADKAAKYLNNGKVAIIPEGFTVSGIPSEQNIDDGLIIYEIPKGIDTESDGFWTNTTTVNDITFPEVQGEYNQFVWIPVETPYVTAEEIEKIINTSNGTIKTEVEAVQSMADNGIYPMTLRQANGGDYKGIVYNYRMENSNLKIVVSDFIETYREPVAFTDGDTSQIDLTREPSQEVLQNDYNKIINSIIEKNGFWVGRYEVKVNTRFESKREKFSVASWYDMYEGCKSMYVGTSVRSYMITGSQWFQILNWMKDIKNIEDDTKYFVVYSAGMGVYNDSEGIRNVRNIFDLAGMRCRMVNYDRHDQYKSCIGRRKGLI